MWFSRIIGPLVNIAGNIVNGWQRRAEVEATGRIEIRQAEIQAEVAQIQTGAALQGQSQANEAAWEQAALKAAEKSWKDEAWTYACIAVLAMCFVPGLAPYALGGFAIIAQVPQWFQLVVGASVAYSFGLRQIVGMIREVWRR